jgi:phosphoribosylanthranilate isomerase
MTEIKICGVTNLEDAKIAVLAGANALGFIFHPGSPRHVTPERSKEITSLLPMSVCKVGVFVDCDAGEVKKISRFCRLDLIQLHGHESPDYCRHFPRSVLLKAVALRSGEDLAVLSEYPVKAIVVDTYDPGSPGGTGKTGDWNLAKRAGEKCALILAGGLNSGNVQAAIERVSPRAVDISSGVETRPGKKDPEKIRAFIAAVKGSGPARTPAPAGRIFQRG